MHCFLLLTAVSSHARSAGNDLLEQRLIAFEKDSWVAWQRQDPAFWEKFLSADHIEIWPTGAVGKQDVIGGIRKKVCTVRSWTADHFTFRRLDPDTAVLVYKATQDTVCGATQVPSPVWATSIFELRDGRWVNVYYSHVPAAKSQ